MNASGRLAGLVIGAMTLSPPAHAQAVAADADVVIAANILNEGFEPAVDVSGSTLKGVMALPSGDPNGQGRAQQLYIWLPSSLDTQGKRLCISLNSRDGQYTSQLEVPLDSDPGLEPPLKIDTVLRADFTTSKPEYYTRYAETPPPHRLAVLAELKSSCSPAQPRDAVLVAGWQPYAAPPQTLSVLVNANRLEALLAVWLRNSSGNSQHGIRCTPIEAASRIAYDTACQFDRDGLTKYGTLVLDDTGRPPSIILRRGGNVAAAVPLELRL